ncbi:MAG: methylmalonyl Co-A mutase-associated GTPase MeaB [Candidatus Eremiobacteraeota bacterium]|nr:methylmalonyl Co-A mutase-associated GTPase MeaB [Candidatus Eremiobacteraeota bacterium]
MSPPAAHSELLDAFRAGDPRALARAISRCESGRGAELIRALYPLTGRALTVGLTGPPGVGKSTLTSALVAHLRRQEKTVGVISVDPSSPFSHGALLGDRIRLAEHFVDPDVFIRSMASRGHLGGLAGATADAVSLMDAFGKDVVLIETVGVGQSEIEIAEVADTTLVALQPGSGDSVQVLKAGVLEIADVFVVNKSDHPMALQLQREIRSMMEMLRFEGWVPVLVSTQAVEGKGIDKLWDAVVKHAAWLRESGALRAKRRAAFAHRVRQLALGTLEGRIETAIDELSDELDPYAAAQDVLQRFGVPDGVHPHAHARAPGEVRAHVKGL